MTVKLLLFLVIGTVAMGIPHLYMKNYYDTSKYKTMILTVILTVTGTVGTFLMYYLENRRFGGLSFFGAVFLVPVAFIVIVPFLRVPYKKALDFCAVGECIMLVLMKIHCIMGGCCLGRVLFERSDGTLIRFPSRLVEMIVAFILFIILFKWSKIINMRGKLYPWYMILYGITRFVLNILREAWVDKEMILPFGNIWSVISFLIGILWLIIIHKKGYMETLENE